VRAVITTINNVATRIPLSNWFDFYVSPPRRFKLFLSVAHSREPIRAKLKRPAIRCDKTILPSQSSLANVVINRKEVRTMADQESELELELEDEFEGELEGENKGESKDFLGGILSRHESDTHDRDLAW
jgi:hypothetical protein